MCQTFTLNSTRAISMIFTHYPLITAFPRIVYIRRQTPQTAANDSERFPCRPVRITFSAPGPPLTCTSVSCQCARPHQTRPDRCSHFRFSPPEEFRTSVSRDRFPSVRIPSRSSTTTIPTTPQPPKTITPSLSLVRLSALKYAF